ncbi:MAG: tetratricopeptide repeat protein [Bacteroidales bacterium]|nr:tetratricopeptide repeat protein [Bacteroidales bacterium]
MSIKQKKYLFSVLILIFLAGCSTQKNTGINRFYHALTTKYNILFNGGESFKEGVKQYQESYQDDYSRILPIFKYGDEEMVSGLKAQMDRAIEKSSKSIKMHSITAKPDQGRGVLSSKEKAFYNKNEYNIFIDDAYLLMGKAFFYQMEYQSAIQTFNFIINQYDDPETKYLAYNWLIRSYVELKDFREAKDNLDLILTEIEYPEEIEYERNLTAADFYLKQNKVLEAESYVEAALEQAKKKKDKLRLTFIHAQINEELNQAGEASILYERVIKMNPPYEMAFNAKIKRAALFSGSDRSGKTIEAELLKMLKDEKNKEYQDQIYYALGELEMRRKNVEKAIEYYQLSAQSSMGNRNQKGLTFLALANIFFEQHKYMDSQAYFDSAVVSIDPEFPGYKELNRKNTYLSKLVKNLKTVQHQDSLQMVAAMSEKERTDFIQKIIQQRKAEEAEQKRRERENNNRGMYTTSRNRNYALDDQSGKWYFYNQTAKSFGEPEFRRRWGDRKLEDNWRRSNKQVLGVEQITQAEMNDEILDPKKGLDENKPEFYLVELPLNDSAMEVSHKKIQHALYNVGEVYRNDLKDYPLAIDAYQELIDRYPESSYKVAAYYSLYKVYEQQNNPGQADIYKNMIIRNYPDSKYAKVLLDPEYFKQFEKEEQQKRNDYIQTLNLYKNQNYREVILRCDNALKKAENSEFIPKYRYLKTLSIGELYGVSSIKKELEAIIEEFPADPVASSSEELLAAIRENELKQIQNKRESSMAEDESPESGKDQLTQKTLEEIAKIYTYNPKIKHLLGIAINKSADINQLKFNLINFNLDFFIQESYDVENKNLNEFTQVVLVKDFENVQKAEEYYNQFKAQERIIFTEIKTTDFQYFIISQENLDNLFQEKSVGDYLIFFRNNYTQ